MFNSSDYGRLRHQEIIDDAEKRRRAMKTLKANSHDDSLAGRIRTAVLSAIISLG